MRTHRSSLSPARLAAVLVLLFGAVLWTAWRAGSQGAGAMQGPAFSYQPGVALTVLRSSPEDGD